jgi:DNA modification methylase
MIRILTGDCREVMRAMPAESVDCIVTSPPYWGLRDYGVAGQLGLEPTLGEHIATMVDVFEAAKRVLKKSGTLWLNYGDSYAAQINGRSAHDTKLKGNDDRTFRDKPFSTIGPIRPGNPDKNGGNSNRDGVRVDRESRLKPKDLCMVPNRLAIALQEAGWWVRSEIIWAKPNPMPESVRDRPTSAHEKIWLLTKSERYFYDAEAIAEPANYPEGPGNGPNSKYSALASLYIPGHSGKQNLEKIGPSPSRNRRNVWTIPSQPFSDAHFATFPPALIEPCVLAGCPKGGTVLDPFGGAGTTGMVADRLGRNAILIELNATYAAMAQSRIVNDLPLFAEVAAE